jgi:Na+-transporting NADH:ubiquinone oxidoreductase subunit F
MWIAFFTGVATVCLLAVLLALLMLIAEAWIADYGEVEVVVNGESRFKVEGGTSLLSTLKEHNLFIPSACGGRGSCGLCKVRVERGGGMTLPTEEAWLSDAEKKERVRLSCQLRVKDDLAVRVPEELLSVREYRPVVESIRDLTHDIKELTLKLPGDTPIEFKAGQFIQLEVPEYELTDEPVYRAYSIASPPSGRNAIELEIRYVPNGICTTYVHRHLKEGDTLTLNGPYGDFFLRDTEREIVFIAGGSGMAPVKSILEDMVDKGISRKSRYFFGARSLRDLFLVQSMKELEAKLPDFRFIPALSEPAPEDDWEGETGLVTEVVKRHVPDASEMEAYLCGSPLMIDACIEVLKLGGMPEGRIYYDKFA